MLILEACERFLRDRGLSVWVSDGSIEDAALTQDDKYLFEVFEMFRGMIFFPGGGNIGIYPDNGEIRATVIRHLRPWHRCLIFPQSAQQPEPYLANKQVTVWCRDATSRSILHVAGIRTELVPDAALYLDRTIPKPSKGNGIFYIKRQPGGDSETIEHGIGADIVGEDLTFRNPLETIVARLSPYEIVISDRLHGGLIAIMMGKKVILLPVGYHKIRAFYETWLSDQSNVAFVRNPNDLILSIKTLRSQRVDYFELFMRFADPAFQRFLMQ